MKLKPIAYLGLVIALLVSVQANAFDPPKQYRSLAWGASPNGSLKKFAGPTSDGTTLYAPTPGKKPAPLFDLPVTEENYSFTHGKLYAASAYLDGRANFDKMKAALIKAYGPPSFSNERADLFKWKWPRSKIEVHLYYQAKFSKTTVTYLNNAI
ncbi:MAG: hypothetical protein Q8L40_11605 [Burkholderiales bacterium]|nr:hypothetical protein [Burkholderiales bacterium]